TRVLLHLVDVAGDDPALALRTVRNELGQYGAGLDAKAEVVALSRSDIADAEQIEEVRAALAEAGAPNPFVISAATGNGMEPLLDALIGNLDPVEENDDEPDHAEKDWSPL
ncbi:MAG TPA: EutP/PduV family microcompartment system protein, partial [Sphingomicrobium sp.]|nr:EutP/PduV family microcompartment system protein [Sphingomicrobium sp.]